MERKGAPDASPERVRARGGGPADATGRRAVPFVDAHHHLWDLEHLYYPFIQDEPPHPFFLGDPRPLRRSFLPEDYLREAGGEPVVATVHVEAECDRSCQVEETRWLAGLAERFGMPNAIVAHAWFDAPNAEAILEAQAAFPLVRGIRSKPVTAASPGASVAGQPRSMQHPKWLAGYARLARYGLSWDLRVPFWHLEEAARVAGEHPDIPVALNHTGFPWDRSEAGLAVWRRGMRALARIPHVHVKLSCVCVPGSPWRAEMHREVVREAIDLFGVERCMFASNVPPDTLQADYRTLLSGYRSMVGDLREDEQRALFHDNAIRFYRVESRIPGRAEGDA